MTITEAIYYWICIGVVVMLISYLYELDRGRIHKYGVRLGSIVIFLIGIVIWPYMLYCTIRDIYTYK
jgi:hypothetical protein